MMRRLVRLRAVLAGGAVILAGAVLAAAPVSAPAAHAQDSLTEIYTSNNMCLGDEASGLVVETCSSSDENQQWTWNDSYQFSNNATGLCLNGEDGAGGVTVQSCTDPTYTDSEEFDVNSGQGYIQSIGPEPNQANQCIYGAGGTSGLAMVECGVDYTAYFDYTIL